MRYAKGWRLLALTSTGLLASPGQNVRSGEYTHAHRLVDVGNGRRLNQQAGLAPRADARESYTAHTER